MPSLRLSSTKGFTLVELAIVLMIIGLLIGGILKGQQMIHNARITSVIRQLQSFKVADIIFRDSYGAVAGDIVNATTRIPNCNSGNNCTNGDGDGIVGTATMTNYGAPPAFATENTQYWKHLALANLIGGVNVGASALDWGQSSPATPLGGGYTTLATIANPSDTFSPTLQGLDIRLHLLTTGTYAESDPNVLDSSESAQIDRKMDDGKSRTGSIRASDGWSGDGPCENYDETVTTKVCLLHFLVNN